jgi:aminopeptidase N
MADVRTLPEAPPSPQHMTIRREDYRPPDWLVPAIHLDFALDLTATRVRARLTVTRNGEHDRPLRLDGDELTPLSVRVDGEAVAWEMDGPVLVVPIAGDQGTVETEVEINPTANTQLMGLYA